MSKGFTYNQIILCRGEIRQACAELLEDMQEQKNKPDAGTICTVVILAELLEHKLFGGGIIQ